MPSVVENLQRAAKESTPKCVPKSKAMSMTKSQIKSAVRRKRSKAQGVGGKPTNVKTFAKDRDIVLIEWIDAYECASGWIELEEALKTKPPTVYSLGFVLKEEKDYIYYLC